MNKRIVWFVGASLALAVFFGVMAFLGRESAGMKLIVNATTAVDWVLGIMISVVAVSKGKSMKSEMGVSVSRYFAVVAVTEVLYAVGALMILSAMGMNVMRYLVELDLSGLVFGLLERFDVTTIRIVGIVGWIGFVLNRTVSFVSPSYLLIAGRGNLHPYFRMSAWTEIALETATTVLVFLSLSVA